MMKHIFSQAHFNLFIGKIGYRQWSLPKFTFLSILSWQGKWQECQ